MDILPILVATVVAFGLAALWYSPVLFVKSWMKSIGMTEKQMKQDAKDGMRKLLGGQFVLTAVMMSVTSVLFGYANVNKFSLSNALTIVLLIWLGYVLSENLGKVLREGRSLTYVAINAGLVLVQLLLAAGIFVLMN